MSECWEWGGYREKNGYGRKTLVRNGRLEIAVHRLAWAWANWNGIGEWTSIPEGMFVCHRCDNPPCFNPEHLFLGTHTDNMRDSIAKKRHYNTNKTHCKYGHEFTKENTHSTGKRRYCRACWSNRYSRRKDVQP